MARTAPAIGSRTVCRAVQIRTSAGVLMYTVLAGHLVITQTITPTGYAEHWRLTFDGTVEAGLRIVAGSYSGMRSFINNIGFGVAPNASLRTPLVKDDGTFSLTSAGRRMFLGGGVLGTAVIEVGAIPSAFAAGGGQYVWETSEVNKWYATMPHITAAAPLAISAGLVLEGGWYMSVYDRGDLDALVAAMGAGLQNRNPSAFVGGIR